MHKKLQKKIFGDLLTSPTSFTTMTIKLTKKFITDNLIPHLSSTKLGRKPKVKLWRIVKAIIYRLKTGVQWRELPLREHFGFMLKSWQAVYHHFNKWSKDGSWQRLWTCLLTANRSALDMSSVQLDGSHTRARIGGEEVGYQKRKASKTTNMLFLTDRQGIPLAVSKPMAGNHHDLFKITDNLEFMNELLMQADIDTAGLFLNADAGFDSKSFRQLCETFEIIANIDINKRNSKSFDHEYLLDEQLYQERFSVERTNAWLDGFKALIMRYEVLAVTWLSLHFLAFSIILLRNVKK